MGVRRLDDNDVSDVPVDDLIVFLPDLSISALRIKTEIVMAIASTIVRMRMIRHLLVRNPRRF